MSCYVSIYLLNYLFIHPAICFHKFIGAKVSGVNSPKQHMFLDTATTCSVDFFLGQKTPQKYGMTFFSVLCA